jgi:hypothetical protein
MYIHILIISSNFKYNLPLSNLIYKNKCSILHINFLNIEINLFASKNYLSLIIAFISLSVTGNK